MEAVLGAVAVDNTGKIVPSSASALLGQQRLDRLSLRIGELISSHAWPPCQGKFDQSKAVTQPLMRRTNDPSDRV